MQIEHVDAAKAFHYKFIIWRIQKRN
jgi:hypothetical protein